eukprot:UN15916
MCSILKNVEVKLVEPTNKKWCGGCSCSNFKSTS